MLVYIKPAPKEKWHGKKGQESFARPFVLEVLVGQDGFYATGLTEEEEQEYQGKLGVDLSRIHMGGIPHPYWSTKPAFITLPYNTSVFDTVKPMDFVKVKNLKASKYVANSLKEFEEGKWPDALFVITDETEELEVKASKIQTKNKCISIALKMTLDEKTNIVQILSEKSVKGRSADFIDVEIDKIITDNVDEFVKYAKMDSKEVYMRASVAEAINRNILTKEGNALYYMGDKIANDREDAIKYFLDPNNQMMKASILEKL